MTQALAPPYSKAPPHPIAPSPLSHLSAQASAPPLSLGHLVTLGPPRPPNLNIAAIWVRDPWVSIQINFWGSEPPTEEVPHTCKIIYYF